jgi:hypothetical protein
VLVTEPAHPAVAVLINPESAHPQVVHVRQQQRCGGDRGLHGPPRHAVVGCDLSDSPARVDHRRQDRRLQPSGASGPRRQLLRHRSERAPATGRLDARQPRLADHHLHPTGVPDVTDPLHTPRVHTRRHRPALGAAIFKINWLHLDPATAQRQVDRVDQPDIRAG